jgi:hypothetical protein
MLLTLVGCATVALLWKYFWASRRPKNFPPGPATLPFIGNLHQLPTAKSFLKYYDTITSTFWSVTLTLN